MKYTHGHHTLAAMAKTLTHKDDVHFLAYIEVMSVLGKFWSDRFSTTEFLVLLFIVNRTLIFRKRAEIISRKHFMEGIKSARGVTCAGVGVSESARIKALNSLCDQDYIHVHSFVDGHVESVPRIYELNYDALVSGYDIGEVQNMLKRSKKYTREAPETDDFYNESTPSTFRGEGVLNRGGITELLHSSNKSSTNVEESAASQPSQPRLKIGKKSRANAINSTPPTAPITGNAEERIAQIQAQATKARSTRVTTAKTLPARRWEIKDLQALLDQARSDAGVSVPRVMATAKGAGVLFKRMKEAEIQDALEFFTWTFQNWGTVASANRRAKAKQLKDTKASHSEMSMIPSFSELAYRFPYILVFFNDRKYTKVQEQEREVIQKKEEQRVVQTQEQAIQVRRELARERDLANREREQKTAARRPVIRRTRVPVEVDLDEAIPGYKESEWKE